MFNAFLSCRVFGLPSYYQDGSIEIARRWSRQPELEFQQDRRIYWGDRTRVRNAGYRWHDPMPPAEITVQNGLVPLGSLSENEFFAFVCPLPGLTVAFKAAAVSYFRDQRETAVITELAIDLTGLVADNWQSISHQVRVYEGIDEEGSHVAISPRDKSVQPKMRDVHSLELDIEGSVTKVDNNFDMRVADVSAEFDAVASSLVTVFEIFKDRLTFQNPPQLSRAQLSRS